MFIDKIEAEVSSLKRALKYSTAEDFARTMETVPIPMDMSLIDAVWLIKTNPAEHAALAVEVAGYKDLTHEMFSDLTYALLDLPDEDREKVGVALAGNRRVPSQDLYVRVLYAAQFPSVCVALASNPYVPHTVIAELSSMARNLSFLLLLFRTHGDILAIRDFTHPDLLMEYQSYVVKRVAEACLATNADDFTAFILTEEQEAVKQELARNPNTPVEMIKAISIGNALSAHFALLRMISDRKR